MGYDLIEVRPVAGALGAEIRGVDLAKPLDDEALAEVRRALVEHLVIFFRDQHLTPETQKAFGRRFGELEVHEYVKGMREHPEVIEVLKEADERGFNFGGAWHSDVSYEERPALGSILYALQTPPYGGDTLWANQYLAYETLSPGMRRMLDGLRAVHTARMAYGPRAGTEPGRAARRSIAVEYREDAAREIEHPVVRAHPESGRRALYVNPVFTSRFAGMTEAESRPLLQFLFAQAVRPEFTCRFRWEPGAVAFWDNRCTQHFALNDYHGFRRHLRRITIRGERPAWPTPSEASA